MREVPGSIPGRAHLVLGLVRVNDLLLVRQDIPLHTTCRSLNFVYFSIPVDQVAPNNTIREDGRRLKSTLWDKQTILLFRVRPSLL